MAEKKSSKQRFFSLKGNVVLSIAVGSWAVFILAVLLGAGLMLRSDHRMEQAIVYSQEYMANITVEDTGVVIHTQPDKADVSIYFDQNKDGINAPSEYLGDYPVYDGIQSDLRFSWTPYPFPEGSNGSYRIALWQDTNPLGNEPVWIERKVAHHWAENPNGTTFVMGSFGYGEPICPTCPSRIVIMAETYLINYNPDTLFTQHLYTLVDLESAPAALQISAPFTIFGH